ncbi:hypothetical protein OTU49_003062, partial [Cherax quadricarinatus]
RMNPWSSTRAQQLTLQSSHVAQYLLKKAEEAEKAAERKIKRAYVVKERNYVTYNYVETKAGGDEENTLSSILVRAMQRKAKRKEIDQAIKIKHLEESKRKVEEEKQRCMEAKRRQNERLREMKENHKLRIMKEEQWREREARQARHNRKADDFCNKMLLRRYFRGFKTLVVISHDNRIMARDHYRLKLMQKTLSKLVLYREKEQHWRESLATSFHNVCLLHMFFTSWRERVSARAEQVRRGAEHYRQRLLRKYLWEWRWAALDHLLQRRADTQRATQHYHR